MTEGRLLLSFQHSIILLPYFPLRIGFGTNSHPLTEIMTQASHGPNKARLRP